MKDVRIGLLQLNMIYEGQLTSASILSTNDFDTLYKSIEILTKAFLHNSNFGLTIFFRLQ